MKQDIEERLVEIFREIFPELTDTDIASVRKTTRDNLASWDSINHLMLISTLEDSFSVLLPETSLSNIDSFPETLKLIQSLPAQ